MLPEFVSHFTGLRTTEALEDVEGSIKALTSGGARQDEFRGMTWMTHGIGHRNKAAEGVAHDDRAVDFERFAKRLDVVGPVVECPAVGSGAVAASLAAMVEVDELGDVGERGNVRLEVGVVESGAAVEEEHCRHLAHVWAVRTELCALDVEEDSGVTDVYAHGGSPLIIAL